MGKIYLIRHGTTEANLKKLYYGKTDVPLANEGVNLIGDLTLGGKYPSADGAMIYTSGMLRTDQTLFLIYGCKDFQVMPELKEYDFGDFEMKTYEEIKDREDYQAWILDEKGLTPCPNGESPVEFKARVSIGLSKLLEAYQSGQDRDKKTIVICHGGVIADLMNMCFPIKDKTIFDWIPGPGKGYELHIVEGEVVSYENIG